MKEKISGFITFILLFLAIIPGFFADESLKGTQITAYTFQEGIHFTEDANFQYVKDIGFLHGAINGAMVVAQSGRVAAQGFWKNMNVQESFTDNFGNYHFTLGNTISFIAGQLINFLVSLFVFLFGFAYWGFQIFRFSNDYYYYAGIVTSTTTIFAVYRWAGNAKYDSDEKIDKKNQAESDNLSARLDSTISSSQPSHAKEPELAPTKKRNCETLLGLSEIYTQEELKQAFRKKMAQYHPDKVEHLGEKLKEVALRESIAIQEAYKYLSTPENQQA
jgi:uncharacterized membrane protein